MNKKQLLDQINSGKLPPDVLEKRKFQLRQLEGDSSDFGVIGKTYVGFEWLPGGMERFMAITFKKGDFTFNQPRSISYKQPPWRSYRCNRESFNQFSSVSDAVSWRFITLEEDHQQFENWINGK